MRVLPLLVSGNAVFVTGGRAVVILGPQRSNEKWKVTYTSIQTTSASTTGMKTYRNFENPSNFIEASIFNGNNDSSDTVLELAPNEKLVFVWTGGTVGANALVSLRGEITVL